MVSLCMGVVFEIMMSSCPGPLVLGIVMVDMRCTPKVTEWSDVSSLVCFGCFFWNRYDYESDDWHDETSFMVFFEHVRRDS